MYFYSEFFEIRKEREQNKFRELFAIRIERYLKNNKRRRIERFKISEKHEKFVRNLKRQIKTTKKQHKRFTQNCLKKKIYRWSIYC